MNLDLTADQRSIRDEAMRFLGERASSERIRRIVDAGEGTDKVLWSTIARELGWCGMAIAEVHGGLGLGMTEMAILMECCGTRLAPMPFWATTCLAAPLIAAAGSPVARERYLRAIASGQIAATVAWPDIGAIEQHDAIAIAARFDGNDYVLDGRVAMVVDLPAADLVLVPARLSDGEVALFALETAGLQVEPLATLDGTRPFGALTLAKQAVPISARIDADCLSRQATEKALAFAMLGLAAEQVGAARGVMDLTLAHIGERVQFGRTIASFQAVKHRCARLEVDMAEARALIYGAASGFGEKQADERRIEVAGARILASELLYRAAEEAIQLHGGVGFTWDYDPHLYFKRAQASAVLFGAADMQLDLIAGCIMAAEAGR